MKPGWATRKKAYVEKTPQKPHSKLLYAFKELIPVWKVALSSLALQSDPLEHLHGLSIAPDVRGRVSRLFLYLMPHITR